MRKEIRAFFQNFILSASMGIAHKRALGQLPAEEAAQARLVLDALRQGRFHFETEIWHDARKEDDRLYPAEMLLRTYTKEGEAIPPSAPLTAIAHAGFQEALDKAIIIAAVDQALERRQMPISINTSARNISSGHFWRDVSHLLHTHFAMDDIKDQITFEVLEDDLAHNPCRDILLQMKKDFGCTFAVDDFYHDREQCLKEDTDVDSFDWTRLDNLKEIADYVKIDGPSVEAGLDPKNSFSLEELISRIKHVVPDACIVFERVKDADQAHALAQMGEAVQGRYLTTSRDEFVKQLTLATHNFPPAPKTFREVMP